MAVWKGTVNQRAGRLRALSAGDDPVAIWIGREKRSGCEGKGPFLLALHLWPFLSPTPRHHLDASRGWAAGSYRSIVSRCPCRAYSLPRRPSSHHNSSTPKAVRRRGCGYFLSDLDADRRCSMPMSSTYTGAEPDVVLA